MRLSDAAPYRGRVTATEYLGTTQIVTFDTAQGPVKVRAPSDQVVREGETTGLDFDARTLTVFNASTGRALRSVANREVLDRG